MTRSGERAPAPERYETNLEWFAFLGGNTVSTHGSESDDVGGGHAGAGSAEIETGGRRGLLLLRPWQWAGSRLDRAARDPLFQERLATHLRAAGPLADQHPEVGDIPPKQMGSSLVWVHGTVSCGLAALPELLRFLPTHVHRFEHDTFQDIDTNGHQLAEQLDERLRRGAELVLVGHSRGGLVSRVAANQLTSARDDLGVTVLTLGTPHLGTPIVNAGDRALRALVSFTKFGLKAVPDPASMLLKYLLRYAEMPTGIRDMAVESGWLRGFNGGGREGYTLLACGADYQRGVEPESSGVKALGRLHRLFEAAGTKENDLVVPTASSTVARHARRASRIPRTLSVPAQSRRPAETQNATSRPVLHLTDGPTRSTTPFDHGRTTRRAEPGGSRNAHLPSRAGRSLLTARPSSTRRPLVARSPAPLVRAWGHHRD